MRNIRIMLALDAPLKDRLDRACVEDALPVAAWIRSLVAKTLDDRDARNRGRTTDRFAQERRDHAE